MMKADVERALLVELINTLTSSCLGMGLAGIEDYALTYERNGESAVATWARELMAELRRSKGEVASPEPEVVAAAAGKSLANTCFWWNHRIYAIRRVRRSFIDFDARTWLEVDAVSFDGGAKAEDDELIVTIPLAAVQLDRP